MKTSAPTQPVLIVSIVLAVLALLGYSGTVAQLAPHSFLLCLAAYVVLLIGNLAKGL